MPNQTPLASGDRDDVGFRSRLFWILVVLMVSADLLSKQWAFSTLPEDHGVVHQFGSWFGWQRLHNAGGVFGLGQSLTVPLTLVRMAAVGLLLWLVARQQRGNHRAVFTLGLLEAGAIGNLYDNLGRWIPWSDGTGHVRDFIRVDLGAEPGWWPDWLGWPFHPWPIFNVADACITTGFLLLLTGLARVHWPGRRNDAAAEGDQAHA